MSTTSVKLKFRESMVEGKEGRLFFRVIRNRCIRQIALPYMIFPDEWSGEGRLAAGSGRPDYIAEIARGISKDREIMERAVASLDARGDYTADDVVTQTQLIDMGLDWEENHEVILSFKPNKAGPEINKNF